MLAEANAERLGDTGGAPGVGLLQATSPPLTDITIQVPGCDYLQIDTFLEAGNDRDANLCSDFSNPASPNFIGEVPIACEGLVFGAAFDDDNPNRPGPGGDNYCDWAELDRARHFAPFSDPPNTQADDGFQGGDCLVPDYNGPGKADITNVGMAASTDGEWLYIGWERSTVEGNERGSLILTRDPIAFGAGGGCKTDQPLTDLREGNAYRIDLSVLSTSNLPEARVLVFEYVGPEALQQTTAQVLKSPNWVPITDPDAVVKALNVRTPKNKVSDEDEDEEKSIDGNVLNSAQWIEVAVNTDAVFGGGCGVDFIGQFATSASDGKNDALKDYSGPFHFVTANLVSGLTLYETCQAGTFDYDVSATLEGQPIDFDNTTVTFDVACDNEAFDAIGLVPESLPSGTLTLTDANGEPPSADLTCEITVKIEGEEVLDSCNAELSETVTVYPPLTATGTLSQDCNGTFGFDSTLTRSSDGSATFGWTFQFDGANDITRDTQEGTGVSIPDGVELPTQITATLTVSDNTPRNTRTGEETCSIPVTVPGITALAPLELSLTGSDDATCDEAGSLNSITATVKVTGGSGTYDLDYQLESATSEDCLDVTGSNGSDSCTFGLGDAFCAEGTLSLTVRDADTNSGCEDVSASLKAVRTAVLDVQPLMSTP